MLDTWLSRKKVREQVEIVWSTYEESYLSAFGPGMHESVTAEFAARGITGYTAHAAHHVEEREVHYTNGRSLPFDLLIAFPPYGAAAHFGSLPSDDMGFIAADTTTRHVAGYNDIFAVGDAADFPVKQAFLAVSQAEAAADQIAALVLDKEPRILFDPAALGVDGLARTETAALGAGLHHEATMSAAMYRVAASPVWRLGRMALGIYLPWRFKAGNPFFTGLPWKNMESGLKPVPAVSVSTLK